MRTDQKILIRKKGAEQVKASCAVFYIPQQLADTKRVKASLLYFRIPQELQESKDTVYLGCRGKIQRPWNVWNLLHHLIFHSQEKERLLRKTAYKGFSAWIHGYLGKGVRRPIPSCAVKVIRDKFPDPEELYMGFRQHQDYPAEYMALD
ncbi:uncharacterized protein LOC121399347 isoform X3 [Xenopus laevis]|uniref:Uncharacterized protein LOC121399347 isoform X3 n=1 Tax=Xenopus laevis TaxID=8355 RepID=A0A8J1M255_XENLA|nr:uncharacterized protein LOC121399347 isoform X3 [Xenopus laevis]